MDKKKAGIRIIAAASAILITAMLAVALLFGCVDGSGGNSQESGVTEPDKIIITTDGYIVKLQPDGMTAVKTGDGRLSLAKTKKAPHMQTPIDLIGYGDYIVSIVSYGELHTLVSVYNAKELNDGTNRIEPVRETVFAGNYYTCRIYEETLYFIAKSSTTYTVYNEETEKIEETGTSDKISDSYEGVKEFEKLNDSNGKNYGGYLLASLSLNTPETSRYTLKSYRSENLSTLYFSRYAIYLAFNTYRGYCYEERVCYIEKLSLDGFVSGGKSAEAAGHIVSRYCMSDNGEYLTVATNDSYTHIYTFDSGMKEAFRLQGLGGYMSSCYFSDGFCYIETSGGALKIDVSDPVAPVVLDSTAGASYGDGLMLSFGEGFSLGVSLSSGRISVSFYQTDGDELYHINTASAALSNHYQAALDRRGILYISELNCIAVCTDGGAYIFGVDLYGYLEYKRTLSGEVDGAPENWTEIYRAAVIDGCIYTVSDGAVIAYGMDLEKTDELITILP